MSPETHLLASWLIATKVTDNSRDCRLVTLAGVLPDADGLGLLIDVATGHRTSFYQQYHHYVFHGAFGAVLTSALLAAFARERGRVALWSLLVFHLHLLCDFVGSRGPSVADLWPIHYLGPFARDPAWIWKGQWRLDGWQNRYLTVTLFLLSLWLAARRGDSVVGVFSRRADAVFVGVLRKWRAALVCRWPVISSFLKRPPWRTVIPAVLLLTILSAGYALWQPGLDIRDGEHDRRRNGIWIGHGWLGADTWFIENHKTNQLSRFRGSEPVRDLAARLRHNHITDVFPHLCPAGPKGDLPPLNDEQAEIFLTEFSGFRVMPWIGGPNGSGVRYRNKKWREAFIANVGRLFSSHPRFAGVHLNVEPLTSGDADFLTFLEELHESLPRGKLLSVAAYPPPTHWHPFPDLHWDENYYREVARRCDQIAVMMYGTALHSGKIYRQLMADWTSEILVWSEGKSVLLGVPTYDDGETDYHHPTVENIENALLGIHEGLIEQSAPRNFQGVAIYAEWETDENEWNYFRQHFLKP